MPTFKWGSRRKKAIQMLKLEYYRIKKGFTVYGLSKATGISRRQLARIEDGTSMPTALKIIEICLALDITPNELLGWEEIYNEKKRITRSNDN